MSFVNGISCACMVAPSPSWKKGFVRPAMTADGNLVATCDHVVADGAVFSMGCPRRVAGCEFLPVRPTTSCGPGYAGSQIRYPGDQTHATTTGCTSGPIVRCRSRGD